MRGKRFLGLALTATLALAGIAPTAALAWQKDEPGTWMQQENGKYRYVYEDGTYAYSDNAMGILFFTPGDGDGEPTYVLDEEGYRLTGWIGTGDHYVYADEDGVICKGWKQIDGSWYHFNADGVTQTGWQEIDGNRYFFNPKGAMQTGWVHDGMGLYWLGDDGVMTKGWEKIDGS